MHPTGCVFRGLDLRFHDVDWDILQPCKNVMALENSNHLWAFLVEPMVMTYVVKMDDSRINLVGVRLLYGAVRVMCDYGLM